MLIHHCRRVCKALLLGSCLFLLKERRVEAFSVRDLRKDPVVMGKRSFRLEATLSTPFNITSSSSGQFESEEKLSTGQKASASPADRQKFRDYLRNLARKVRSKTTVANRMDDELKRMEIRYYDLSDDDNDEVPVLRYPDTMNYGGPVVQPDESIYAMVANAYAKSGMRGSVAAELAEEVYQRCLFHDQRPTTHLRTAVLNAWAHADDWTKVDEWLGNMEETFKRTGQEVDAPDSFTYASYLEGVARSQSLERSEMVERTEKIMSKLDDPNNPCARPNRFTHVAAMKCLCRENNGLATLDRVESLLQELVSIYDETGDPEYKPKTVVWIPVLTAAARCKGGMEAALRAESVFKDLQNRFLETSDPDYRLNEAAYTAVLTALARVEPEAAPEAARKVDNVLDDLENDPSIRRPSVHVYTAAINAKLNNGDAKSLEEAEDILRSLRSPDSVAYQCVIRAHARMGNAAKAEELLWELNELASSSHGNPHLVPADVITIAACVNAWVKSFPEVGELALERSTMLLQLIIDAYREGTVHGYERDVEHWIFDEVIRLWSISRRRDAGEEAERLVEAMVDLNKKTGMFAPNLHTYTLALDAWTTSGREDAGKRASELLETVEKLYDEGELTESPNTRALSTVLTAVTKSGGRHSSAVAESFFRRIIDLYDKGDRSANINARTATSVLAAIVRSPDKDAPKRAMALLEDIKAISEHRVPSLQPNVIVYNSCLHGLAERGLADEAEVMLEEMIARSKEGFPCKPDIVSYSCVCRAIANQRGKDSGPRALGYLDHVKERFRNGDTTLKPDTVFYNSCLTAFTNDASTNPDAASRAESILREMEFSKAGDCPVDPDLVSFGSVCQAFAKTSDPSAASKVDEVLERAEELVKAGILPELDCVFYSSLAHAYTRSRAKGSIKRAEDIVRRMEQLALEGHLTNPSIQVYNNLLSGWATSTDLNRLDKATELFSRMEDLGETIEAVRPDASSHNWMILAAARSPSELPAKRREHFDVALKHFRTLHDKHNDIQPNSFSYSYFIRACRKLLPEGEDLEKLIEKAFELSKQTKNVSKEVLAELFLSNPLLLQDELQQQGVALDIDDAIVEQIPEVWCSNLPPRRRRKNIELHRWH